MKPMLSPASTSKTLVKVVAVSALNKWIIHWSFPYIVESKVLKYDGILIHMKKGRTQTRSCLKQPNWISTLCNQLFNRILKKCQGKFLKRNVNLFFYFLKDEMSSYVFEKKCQHILMFILLGRKGSSNDRHIESWEFNIILSKNLKTLDLLFLSFI